MSQLSLLILPVLAFFVFPFEASAATYQLLAPLGTLSEVTLSMYLEGMVRIVIGIAGILAVVMIVICGIQMIGSPSVSQKEESKKCIWNAILGLLLAISSWVILNTINENLLASTFVLQSLPVPAAIAPGAPPAGNYSWVPGGTCTPVAGQIVAAVPATYCGGSGTPGAVCCGYAASPLTPPTVNPFPPPPPFSNPFLPPTYPPGTPGSPGSPGSPGTPPPPGTPGSPGSPGTPPPPAGPPTPGTYDSRRPVVGISQPLVNGYVVTGGAVNVTYSVVENIALGNVRILILNAAGATVSTATICSQTSSPCSPLGMITTSPVNFSALPTGNYTIRVETCDVAGNCGFQARRVRNIAGCTATNPACRTDHNALTWCVGQPIAGSCANADLNADGVINTTDLGILNRAAVYDINADGSVDATNQATNFGNTCFFYTAQDPLFPCALNVLGDITITAADKTNFETTFVASRTGTSRVSLALLDANLCSLFPCTSPGMGLGGTDQLSIYGEAMFSTIAAYDFNGDGTVDWGSGSPDIAYFNACMMTPTDPLCSRADVNGDNYITPSDLHMISNVESNWSGGLSLLSDMERRFWDGVFQPEAGILSVCRTAITPLALLCEAADYNNSGRVDDADLAYLQGVSAYDVNGDGVVIYTATPLVPVLTIASAPVATSITFTNGDRVETRSDVFVRSSAGNTQPMVGIVLNTGQGTVSGGPVFVDSNWWWRVTFDAGITGWAIEPVLQLTATPTPPPPPPPSGFSTRFRVGDIVGSTANLTVRSSPSTDASIVGSIPVATTQGTVIGGPVFASGYSWWQINWTSGISGWSVQDWAREFIPPPAPNITFPTNGSYLASNEVTIRGTMPAREVDGTVTVSRGATLVGSGVIDTAGSWQVATTLPDGFYTISAIATDQSQNVGPVSTSRTFTIDTTPPLMPNITWPGSGATVNTATFTMTGVGAEAGNTIYIYANTTAGALLGTAVANGSGNWTFTLSRVDGPYTFAVIERDRAANTSPANILSITVDAPPSAPTITTPSSGIYVNTNSVTVAGTGFAGNTLRIYNGGTVLSTTAITGPTWTTTLSGLADDVYSLYAEETDPGQNVSPPSSVVTVTVDTIAPTPPIIISPVNGAITSTTVTAQGTGQTAGDTITLTVNGIIVGTAIVNGALNWSFTGVLPAPGSYTLTATETDRALNVSAVSASVTFTAT